VFRELKSMLFFMAKKETDVIFVSQSNTIDMPYSIRHYILLFFLLVSADCIYAQTTDPFRVKEFDAGELSSDLINRITQDTYGFIWIATDYGLNKFDGMRFTQYLHNENDSTSILSNNVRSLLIDKKGTLWIGYNKGLQYYNPNENSFITVPFPEGISPHISKMTELHTGEIWVTTSGWGIFSIDPNNYTAQYQDRITTLTDMFTGLIYEDSQHYIWIGIEHGGLVRIDPTTYRTLKFSNPDISEGNVIGILEDDENHFFMSTSTEVYIFDRMTQKFSPLEYLDGEGLNITNIIRSRSGIIYVTTDGMGLKYIDNKSNKISSIRDKHNSFIYHTAKIPAIAEDNNQNLWLGCIQEGLFMLPYNSTEFGFWEVMDKEFRRGKPITAILEDHSGNVWCSINGEGLFKLEPNGEIMKCFNEVPDIMTIYEDRHHQLWISSYTKGLGRIDVETGQIHFLNIPFKGYYMKTIEEGADQQLYISTFGYGFISYNIPTGQWEKYDIQQEDSGSGILDNNWINCIKADPEGLIWLGHYKGVSCFDPRNKQFINYKYKDILSEQVCISLIIDDNGLIWVGTYNGLFCINKQTEEISRYTVEDGLSSNVICGLASDKRGDIWCSTFNGINKLQTEDKRIISFFTGNGLIDKIYLRGVYFQSDDEKIYFGGNSGIVSFSPENIEMPSYQNNVRTTNVYIHNKLINKNTLSGNRPIIRTSLLNAKEFNFAYEDNTFTFEFSTMDFLDPGNISYLYRLRELSDKWSVTLPGINQITYNHLNPGKYTLEVMASKYGAHSPIEQFFVRISPPWYRSTWAWLIYLAFFVGVSLLVAILIRKKQKEQVNEAKLQFFINISHEIRSPLTLIISPLEKLMSGDYDQATLKIIQGIHRNANRLLDLVNQLLDIRKFDKGLMKLKSSETDMVGFIREIYKVFEYQANKRNIHFVFDPEISELPVWIDRNNFDKALMNLLSNAFKYTPDGGEIEIALNTGFDNRNKGFLHHYVEIKITDSGIGLDEDKIDKIFERFYQGQQKIFSPTGYGIGLNLTKKLVQLHHGSITAANRKDAQGSCFTVRIPFGKEHLKKEDITEKTIGTYSATKQTEVFYKEIEKEKTVKRKTNYKILIVDDEEEIREYLIQELKNKYQLLTASDGQEALQIALSQHLDLIISDVMMPKLDGIDLVKKLKGNNNVSHIPILLLTSKTEFKDRIEGLEKGADAYLTKPFNIAELSTVIANLLRNRLLLKGKYSGVQDQKDKIEPIKLKSNDEILMERIMGVINTKLSDPDLTVEVLASEVGLSRSQLHRRMKELTGISTNDFIRNIRLKQAAVLFKEKKMDVSQVAYAVGITNLTYFSTMFKRYYGLSPTEYIIQVREGEK